MVGSHLDYECLGMNGKQIEREWETGNPESQLDRMYTEDDTEFTYEIYEIAYIWCMIFVLRINLFPYAKLLWSPMSSGAMAHLYGVITTNDCN